MVKVLRKVLLLVALFLVLLVTAAFAVDYGIVTTDVLNFRAGPGTNYEIIGQLRRGEVVRIIGNGGNNWVEIVHNDRQGYVSLAYLSVRSDGETDRGSVNRTAQDGYVTASALNMRSGPSTNSSVLRVLGNGPTVSKILNHRNTLSISQNP